MKYKIAHMRRLKNIKQCDLAKSIRVSPSYLCKIEKGLIEPNEKFIKDCAKALKVTTHDLIMKKEGASQRAVDRIQCNRLWTVRKQKGMKQYALAEMIGCSPSYLSKVEKGLQSPNKKFKSKCAKILKIKEMYLFPA